MVYSVVIIMNNDEIEELEENTYTLIQIFKKMGIKVITTDGIDLTEKVEDLE